MPYTKIAKPITEPEHPGINPEQIASTEEYSLIPQPTSTGISQLPLTETLQAIMASGVRGESGMTLLIAFVQTLEANASNLKQQITKITKTTDEWKDKYYKKKILAALLQERLKTQRTLTTSRKIMTTTGALVLGISASSIPEPTNSIPLLNGLALTLGIFLLVVGWLPWPKTSSSEETITNEE